MSLNEFPHTQRAHLTPQRTVPRETSFERVLTAFTRVVDVCGEFWYVETSLNTSTHHRVHLHPKRKSVPHYLPMHIFFSTLTPLAGPPPQNAHFFFGPKTKIFCLPGALRVRKVCISRSYTTWTRQTRHSVAAYPSNAVKSVFSRGAERKIASFARVRASPPTSALTQISAKLLR